MTGSEWKALALFGGVVLGVSFIEPRAAWVLVGTLALVAAFTHTNQLLAFVGAPVPKG